MRKQTGVLYDVAPYGGGGGSGPIGGGAPSKRMAPRLADEGVDGLSRVVLPDPLRPADDGFALLDIQMTPRSTSRPPKVQNRSRISRRAGMVISHGNRSGQ